MTHSLEIEVPDKKVLDDLINLVGQENASIEKVEWKSKYNSYVVYDYEPFCSDGFGIHVNIVSSDKNTLEFIKYLYDKKQKELELIKTCYELSTKNKLKK